MGSFNSTIITSKGHALMAKTQTGTAKMNFSKISSSDYQYPAGTDFEALTALSGIKQTSVVSGVSKVNDASVKVTGSFTNAGLATGYYLRNIGLFAIDPDEGEILYSITTAIQADWIPPDNGISVSSVLIDLITVISNASNVTIDVDPNAVATINDINLINAEISDLKGFVGYTENDIYGVEVDFPNNKFTRLAGAVNKTPGADFNGIAAFGGRKRCILTDGGVVLAYYGETGYTETGATTVEIIKNGTTYPVGTAVQVMVEQPKFYYRVVPITLEKIAGGIGYHLRKARYYVSDTIKKGFKVHPAFVSNGVEKNKIYLSAYEGSLFDTSALAYLLADEQVADFTATTGDKLSSIANAKPASGVTQNLTRANTRVLANNRGAGWQQSLAITAAATEMLMLIEYATFEMQTAIGKGVVEIPDTPNTANNSINTGSTGFLGNNSGSAVGTNGQVSISYRGEENPWGNIWKWQDGLNIECKGIHQAYWADNAFADDIKTAPYKNCGFTLAKTNGYVSAFGYTEECDFFFLASETVGASNQPVGDYFYQNNAYNGFLVALLGGSWTYGLAAGAFYWDVGNASSGRSRNVGGRLLYVPAENAA